MASVEKRACAVIVIAVVILSTAVYMSLSGEDHEKGNKDYLADALRAMYENDSDYPARLLILGNADLDDDLDEDDLEIVNHIASLSSYDYVDNFMCDANYDGVIDDGDVERLEQMIAKDSNGLYTYNDVAYYVDCDFVVSKYHMDWPLHTSNILTQTLQMLMILDVDSIIALDDRCANSEVSITPDNGTYWKEFAGVLDYSELGSTGSYRHISAEQYLQVAKEYGDGYLTAVMNSRYARNTGYLEEQLENCTVQLVRIQSWERGAVCNGMLTLGYLFHKYDRASEWVSWHDGYYNAIMEKVAALTDEERKAVVIAVLSDTDNVSMDTFDMLGVTSGEYQSLKKMGIIDVTHEYLESIGAPATSWSVSVNKETLAEIYRIYHFDFFIGTFSGPYNIGPINPDRPDADVIYNQTKQYLDKYCGKDAVTLQTFGWVYATGPHELAYIAGLANVLYGWTEFDVKKIVNESLQWMGIYDEDGSMGDYFYNYEDLEDSLYWPRIMVI